MRYPLGGVGSYCKKEFTNACFSVDPYPSWDRCQDWSTGVHDAIHSNVSTCKGFSEDHIIAVRVCGKHQSPSSSENVGRGDVDMFVGSEFHSMLQCLAIWCVL